MPTHTHLRRSYVLIVLIRQDSRKAVFDRAEREITILLRENVLHKFKATDAYKHVNDELLAIGTSTDAAFQRIAPFL